MRTLAALLMVTVVVAACGSTDSDANELTFAGAWSRPTPGDATNGVVYFSVTSPIDDEILSVSVPASIAAEAMMHETLLDGIAPPAMPGMDTGDGSGEMSMVPLESLPLKAGEAVVFEAGAKHIMLTDLAAPLVEGQTFTLTFELREAGTQAVSVQVMPNPPK
jgi:periplasmic copper chaperone A